jgi:hypothetical protein
MRVGAPLLLLLAILFATAVFISGARNEEQPQTWAAAASVTPTNETTAWTPGGDKRQESAAAAPQPTRQSAHQDPFSTGRSWFGGSISGPVLYLEPDSALFKAAARSIAAEHDGTTSEPPMQLVQPAPPDAAASF